MLSIKNKTKRKNRNKTSKKRRNNAILYPIYKACSWDLLCFYSIEFLFYTITKGLTSSQALIITSIYIISKILFQIPSVAISDYLGRKKSIILGNALLILYMLTLIFAPNFLWILIANIFCGFGYDLKTLSEGNLLYDSVATKGGNGIYTKIDSRGASGYYILDTILAIIAGYLFVINNYIPMIICLLFLSISFVLSLRFEDIHRGKKEKHNLKFTKFIKNYSSDIIDSFKFIRRSERMKAYIIFAGFFYGFIKIISTYRSDLLVNMEVSEEQFSMIYAILSLIAAISVTYSRKMQKYFKNKTLTVLSLSHIFSVICAAIISIQFINNIALPIVLVFYIIIKICDSQWYITEYTYLKNFTTSDSRNKISFTFELITGVIATIMSLIGAILLDYLNIKYAILVVGLLFLAIIVVILDYMRTRIGLKPKEYSKEDIKFKIKE